MCTGPVFPLVSLLDGLMCGRRVAVRPTRRRTVAAPSEDVLLMGVRGGRPAAGAGEG
jgi:hypothetical protein